MSLLDGILKNIGGAPDDVAAMEATVIEQARKAATGF